MAKKKVFTLISGEGVRLGDGSKIIPANTFSRAVTAAEVLNRIEDDAKQYKLSVADEIEKIKEQAQAKGFEEGFAKWADQLALLQSELKKARVSLEKMVLPIALKAAKKIVGRELELSETAVVDIIANNLRAVSQNRQVIIYVNRQDYDTIEKNKDKLKAIFDNLESLTIRPKSDVNPGSCVIETESGIIQADLENQWQILEKAFQSRT